MKNEVIDCFHVMGPRDLSSMFVDSMYAFEINN